MNSIAEKYIRQEALPFIFCPGCGHGIVVNSFIRAIDELGIKENEMALVSGIGCSSWSPVYLKFDCLHTLHGRALAQAEGLKATRISALSCSPATATVPASAATILFTLPSATWT